MQHVQDASTWYRNGSVLSWLTFFLNFFIMHILDTLRLITTCEHVYNKCRVLMHIILDHLLPLKLHQSYTAIMELCCQLESVCISVPTKSSLVVLEHLQRYRAELRREMILNAKQTTLDTFWNH